MLNRQARPPTQCTNSRTIEEYERTVTYPSALTPSIRQLRVQAKIFANPSDRVVYFAVFVGSKIEDVDFAIGTIECGENGVDTILDIQIGLPLMAIAQHVQMVGVLGKLPPKIEHVPVRVTLSKNRYESKNVGLHSETFAVGLNQSFRSELGSPVK